MKKIIFCSIISVLVYNCQKVNTKNNELLTLKVSFLNGRIDTINSVGSSFGITGSELIVDGAPVAKNVESVSFVKKSKLR